MVARTKARCVRASVVLLISLGGCNSCCDAHGVERTYAIGPALSARLNVPGEPRAIEGSECRDVCLALAGVTDAGSGDTGILDAGAQTPPFATMYVDCRFPDFTDHGTLWCVFSSPCPL